MENMMEPNRKVGQESSYQSLVQAAIALRGAKEYKEAVRVLRKAIKQEASDSQAYILLGLVYEKMEESEKAEEFFRRALKISPLNSEVLKTLGTFLTSKGNVTEGFNLLFRYIEFGNWKDLGILRSLSKLDQNSSRIEDVKNILKEAWEKTLEEGTGNIYASFLRDTKDYLESSRVFEAIARLTSSHFYWNQCGICLVWENKNEKALEAFEKAISSAEIKFKDSMEDSLEYYSEEGEWTGEIEPRKVNYIETDKTLGTYYLNRSYVLLKLNRYSEALDAVLNAGSLVYESSFFWECFAKSLLALERFADAEGIAKAGIAIGQKRKEDTSELYKLLLSALAQQEKIDEYIQILPEALHNSSFSISFYEETASLLAKKGRLEEAIFVIKAVDESEVDTESKIVSYVHQFILYQIMGKTTDAWQIISPYLNEEIIKSSLAEWISLFWDRYIDEKKGSSAIPKHIIFDLLEHVPGEAYFYAWYSSTLLTAGDYSVAEEFIEKGMSLENKHLMPLFINNLAFSQIKQGKLKEAQKSFSKAVGLADELKGSYWADYQLFYWILTWKNGTICPEPLLVNFYDQPPASSVFNANHVAIALSEGNYDNAESLAIKIWLYEPELDWIDKTKIHNTGTYQASQFLAYFTMGCVALAKENNGLGIAFLQKARKFQGVAKDMDLENWINEIEEKCAGKRQTIIKGKLEKSNE